MGQGSHPSPETIARLVKVMREDPELTNKVLMERFRVADTTIKRLRVEHGLQRLQVNICDRKRGSRRRR